METTMPEHNICSCGNYAEFGRTQCPACLPRLTEANAGCVPDSCRVDVSRYCVKCERLASESAELSEQVAKLTREAVELDYMIAELRADAVEAEARMYIAIEDNGALRAELETERNRRYLAVQIRERDGKQFEAELEELSRRDEEWRETCTQHRERADRAEAQLFGISEQFNRHDAGSEAVMSIEGAPDCGICGAHGDYCHLATASGIEIDCRNLQLKNPDDLAFNIGLAGELRSGCEAQHDESMNPVFKSARTDHAPKTREELSDRIDQQLDEHAADYERLASGDLPGEREVYRSGNYPESPDS
jgi:hypothetical protein